MKKIKEKKDNSFAILTSVIVAVTLLSGALFIYVPFLNKNKSLRSEILYERDRNVLLGEIRALNKHLKVYRKRTLSAKDASWFLGEVSDMARKENIEISSVKPGVPEDRGIYTKLNIIMETMSSYHHLGKFLSRVESSEKFLRVEKINIKRVDADPQFDKEKTKFKSFDVKSYIEISTVVVKE
jgi:Tfp pilus assembly protein PilO